MRRSGEGAIQGSMVEGGDSACLIEALISGMVEEPLWSGFLTQLRERTEADYCSLVFRPFSSGPERNRVIHIYSGQPSPEPVSQLYHNRLYLTDPMPYLEMEDGRVYALSELLRFGDPDHDSYRYQFLIPSGMNILRMLRVVEPGGVSAWLTVSRREGEFGPEVDRLVAGIGPYLRSALRSFLALERERINASVASEAIRRMNFGWLTLDAAGRVIDADHNGGAMLASSAILTKERNGRLAAREKRIDREIGGAIRALVADPHSRPRAVVLSREPWLDMLLVAANFRGGATRPAPDIVAYIHADRWSSADRCEQLGQLFDLAPSEARLALALSRGLSIAEAAQELGFTVETVRTYSKRIYAKTGARGQVDLVRFIHRSVLAIA